MIIKILVVDFFSRMFPAVSPAWCHGYCGSHRQNSPMVGFSIHVADPEKANNFILKNIFGNRCL